MVAPHQRLGENPDWNDLQVILDTLLDGTEKKMVLNTGQEQGTLDENFPATDPEWDPNQPGPWGLLTRYQRWILCGIRHAMPKAINWSKLYRIKQEPNESPSTFMERLKVTARKYTNLDPEKPKRLFNWLLSFWHDRPRISETNFKN
ncbi:hypothetical protein QYF61_014991 [Mycteria americana]|uniref:Core shell protein Gag P30 domain-containing protein n=1 Tax=Mycteria americana TaxID=33587 RepID=A0AAN7NT99_MYCAM|nr:hypothetical protein QYF61_014991 [Mycteria americana]